MLSDEDAYFPNLTVAEHLRLVALGHGVADVEETVRRELRFFALTEAADVVPSRLSSGQRRRLLLAAALIRPYRVLALDEPEQRRDAGMRDRLAARLAEPAGDVAVLAMLPLAVTPLSADPGWGLAAMAATTSAIAWTVGRHVGPPG